MSLGIGALRLVELGNAQHRRRYAWQPCKWPPPAKLNHGEGGLGGRGSGRIVSALESRPSGLDSSLGRGTALCSWARHFTIMMPLFTQVYKWVLANLLLGGGGGGVTL